MEGVPKAGGFTASPPVLLECHWPSQALRITNQILQYWYTLFIPSNVQAHTVLFTLSRESCFLSERSCSLEPFPALPLA